MGFFSDITDFVTGVITDPIASIATGLLGYKGANDRNEQQLAMTREQMAWQERLLERDARGGTRYTEIIRSHFGVVSPDSRLQRPEYLGGSSVPVNIAPVAQTSASAISGSATPQGNLAAIGTMLSKSRFLSNNFRLDLANKLVLREIQLARYP